MSGVNLTYRYVDLGADPAMVALASYFDDLTPLMDEMGAEIEDQTVERFQTNISPDGTPWLPSERVKQAQGQALILVDRGHLRDSITRVSSARQTQVGTSLIYGAIHQEGGEAGRGGSVTIDARPYLGLGDQDEVELIHIAQGYYTQAIGGFLQ